MQIIGLVGEKGSGKDTFAKFLQAISKKTIAHIRFSDLLKQTLTIWDLPITRVNLQKIAQVLENEFGEGTIARGLKEQIKKTPSDIIILDGIRWEPDLKLIKSFAKNLLVYITADPKLRFKRLKQRGEKIGESNMTYEQFLIEEKAQNELLIPKIGKSADFKIENNTSLDEFEREIKKFVNLKV